MTPSEVVGVEIPQNLLEFIENKLKQKLTEQNLDAHHVSRMMRTMDARWDVVIQSMVDLGKFRFENEEVASISNYGKFYKGPKPIEEQISLLASLLGLDSSHALAYIQQLPSLPEGAEGWFAVPSVGDCEGITDSSIAKIVFEKLGEVTDVDWDVNFESAELHNAKFSCEIRKAFSYLRKMQPGDIWIIPAQLGMRHRGRSPRCAQEKYLKGEFGLSSYMFVSILLNHLDLMRQSYDLGAICAGDYFDEEWDGSLEVDKYEYCMPSIEIFAGEDDRAELHHFGESVYLCVNFDDEVCITEERQRRGSATGFLV